MRVAVLLMADTYPCFEALRRSERRGTDYRVRSRARNSATVVVAAHGGGIEPGTSEIAEAIAGNELSFYAFEGTKPHNNGRLHITSTRFDEPRCLALVTGAERVITIHGENSKDEVVFLGGRDVDGLDRLREALEPRGFRVRRNESPELQGRGQSNICNRGRLGAGIQIELSSGLRRSFFRPLPTSGRKAPTERFREFVVAVREVIEARGATG